MDVSLSKAAAAYKIADAMGVKGGITGGDQVALQEDAAKQPAFDQLVAEGLEQARGSGYKSEAVSTASLANKAELHELVGAISNAELTLNTVVAVRDKMIGAYQEILRMPI
jgi:flagellar hook-basal body complex protein FliE